jgi:hypothetical protein
LQPAKESTSWRAGVEIQTALELTKSKWHVFGTSYLKMSGKLNSGSTAGCKTIKLIAQPVDKQKFRDIC